MTTTLTAPARTVGTLTHLPAKDGAGRPAWAITALPHVMIRIKRMFPRVAAARAGTVYLVDTAETARDLQWLCDRHPLAMDDATEARLAGRADEHRERVAAIDNIMAGRATLALELEPARPLRDYQQVAVQMVRATGRMVLGDELGLGKSASALGLLADPEALPALVVCPTHLQHQWLRELGKVWPLLRGHVVTRGRPYDLRTIRKAHGYPPDVLVVPYSKLAGWSDALAGQFPTVIFDEAHELRTGTETYKGAAAAQVAEHARYVLGLTATPVLNYGDEIHNIYSIIVPDALGSRSEFLREFGGSQVGNHTKIGDPAALGTYLRETGLFLQRTRRDVGRELPDVLRVRHEVDADPDALNEVSHDVAAMAKLVLDASAKNTDRFVAAGDLDWRLRQATGIAKAPYVAEFVRMLLDTEQRVVLFGWHRACYDIWRERLAEFRPLLCTGSESPLQKAAAVDAFLNGDSRVLIISLRSGAGLDGLQAGCSAAVFGELDWSPGVHDQAIGRLNRDGQTEPVAAYFLVANEGADPVMDEVLQLKRGQAEPIVNPDAKLLEPTAQDALDRVRKLARSVLDRAGQAA